MSTTPLFFATPVSAQVQISTANTVRDGTGTLGTLGSVAPTGGQLIEDITITATGTTTAGAVRMFIFDGTNTRFLKEFLVPAITPSTSVEVFYLRQTINIILAAGWVLKFSTHNAETFNIVAVRSGSV